jgi:hypothetical protein
MGSDWSRVADRFLRKSLHKPPIVVPPAPPATIHGTHRKSAPLDDRIFSGSISRSLGSDLSQCGLSLDLNLSLSFTIVLSLDVESEEGRGIGLEKEENNRSVRERREEKG